MTAADALRARIATEGPVPFDVFQELALYGPDGFFTSGPLRSAATGDFLTSPEVSPWFGRMLGRFAAGRVAGISSPLVVEAGAGSGSLLEPLLTECAADAWVVEASPMAREALTAVVPAGRIAATLDGIPDRFDGVVIANELIDNLPVALAVRRGSHWLEHHVGLGGSDPTGPGFVFVEAPARAAVAAWADRFGGAVPEGGIVEVQLTAGTWLAAAIGKLRSGSAVLVDYGGTVAELEPRRQTGTLRTYRGHHLGPDPLLEPGLTDITVDVNFSALVAVAAELGGSAQLMRQDDFLSGLGLRAVVSDLRQRELELARHGDTLGQLEARTERIAAETLLHPRGLGDFRVLVVDV
jgi:SAM-dependent MidA family methyltransferase